MQGRNDTPEIMASGPTEAHSRNNSGSISMSKSGFLSRPITSVSKTNGRIFSDTKPRIVVRKSQSRQSVEKEKIFKSMQDKEERESKVNGEEYSAFKGVDKNSNINPSFSRITSAAPTAAATTATFTYSKHPKQSSQKDNIRIKHSKSKSTSISQNTDFASQLAFQRNSKLSLVPSGRRPPTAAASTNQNRVVNPATLLQTVQQNVLLSQAVLDDRKTKLKKTQTLFSQVEVSQAQTPRKKDGLYEDSELIENPYFSPGDLNFLFEQRGGEGPSQHLAQSPVKLTRFNYLYFRGKQEEGSRHLKTKSGGLGRSASKRGTKSIQGDNLELTLKLPQSEQIKKSESKIKGPVVSAFQVSNTSSSKKKRNMMRKTISETDFRKLSLCQKLDEDFENKLNLLSKGLLKKYHPREALGAITAKDLVTNDREQLQKKPESSSQFAVSSSKPLDLLPHGGTFTDIPHLKNLYRSCKLEEGQKTLLQDKLSNISNVFIEYEQKSEYQKSLENYHQLYLNCVESKDQPILTEMLKEKKTKMEKLSDNYNVYVRFNPDSKSKLGSSQMISSIHSSKRNFWRSRHDSKKLGKRANWASFF